MWEPMKWPGEPVTDPASAMEPFYEGSFLRMILNRMSRMLHQVRTSPTVSLIINRIFTMKNWQFSLLPWFRVVELRHESTSDVSGVASGVHPAPEPQRVPIGRLPSHQRWRQNAAQRAQEGRKCDVQRNDCENMGHWKINFAGCKWHLFAGSMES